MSQKERGGEGLVLLAERGEETPGCLSVRRAVERIAAAAELLAVGAYTIPR